MKHHAYAIEAEADVGIAQALTVLEETLGLVAKNNPDVIVLRYGLFSVEDARRVSELATQAPLRGSHKAIIIAADRAYHEAQNALLKLFEEPTPDTTLFLILPNLGGLLSTLRSRVQILHHERLRKPLISESAQEFMGGTKEKRSAMIKRLTAGTDDEDKRAKRDEAIAIVNGTEVAAHQALKKGNAAMASLLTDIATLRPYLHDRSAPVRMILEHLSLVTPNNLEHKK